MTNLDPIVRALREQLPELEILEYEPMRAHCSFRIGGPARRMAFPKSGEQLVLLVSFARACGARPYTSQSISALWRPVSASRTQPPTSMARPPSAFARSAIPRIVSC